MRYRFIAEHREQFAVLRLCKVLEVSPSGYYAWRRRQASQREMANRELLQEITTAYEASNGTYGSPRVYQEVKDKIACSENRVARLMKQHHLRAKQRRCYKQTTKANARHPLAPNRIARDFSATAPNEKWGADITYIPTQEGWLYLAVILDLFSRRVIGWAMSPRLTADLVKQALQMAFRQRRPAAGLIHHSDRGSQYTGSDYQQCLQQQCCLASMSSKGNCYDNAPVESFFARLKMEQVHHVVYETRAQAQSDLFYYIEAFYNRKRRHSSLGYLSPADYEAAYYQRLSPLTMSP